MEAEAATVTPLDQVLWSTLAREIDQAPFAAAWLALLCRMVPGARRAVLVLRQGDALAPVARWPEGDGGSAQLAATAELALRERRGVVSRPGGRAPRPAGWGEAGAHSHLGFPLLFDDQDQGVVAIETDATADAVLREAMRHLQWGTSWIELHRRRLETYRLRNGYVALEAAATALSADRFDAACRGIATEMAVRLDARRVSIGWLRHRTIHVSGLSHAVPGGRRADAIVNLTGAMEEAVDQQASIAFPLDCENALPSRSAHARLVEHGGGNYVLTVPLTVHGRIAGAVTVERDTPIDQPLIDLVEAIGALAGPILSQLHRNERWLIRIAADIALRTGRQLIGPEHFVLKLTSIVLVAIVCFFAVFHIDDRVSAGAVVEGEVRRTIAAGLDGYIGSEHARAGQIVHAGDALATLDDAELNLQRLRWIATRQQHQLELDRALASGTRAEVNIDTAQVTEASAEIALLDAQLARTRIVAPFDGIITNGDLSQSVGMPVQRAQVLFEIAPLDSYRVIIHVPDTEIDRVSNDAVGSIVLSALPDSRFGLHVVRVTPVAEQHDGTNAFRVEARLDDVSPRLRPNMEGVAKLNAGRHLLIWTWTHHLFDAARLWLWSWWP